MSFCFPLPSSLSVNSLKVLQTLNETKVWCFIIRRCFLKITKKWKSKQERVPCNSSLILFVSFSKMLKNCGLFRSHYLLFECTSFKLRYHAKYNKSLISYNKRLISDTAMYFFFKKDMRRGVSNFSDRYSQAKNKYFKIYDLKQDSEHIMD